ncbi:hypothetical protein ACJU26_09070 [Acidithiobacillus sp. M4-SHS-6]|uniref:hypothetical protein n=1 Tax=Acidithiobacillus sp. M4-SHS-6 TaxID=3383024 RepID=UPI0039BE7A1E
MRKSSWTWLSLVLAASLAGCGVDNNDYQCKMPGACAPVRMTYDHARENTSWSGWSVDGQYGKIDKTPKKGKVVLGVPGNFSGVSAVSARGVVGAMEHPVYHPPTPYMVWLAPYVTRHHHLHSSSLEWFTVPGYWVGPDGLRIRPSHKRGAVGMGNTVAWHPLQPDEMGFRSFGKAVRAANSEGILGNVIQPK